MLAWLLNSFLRRQALSCSSSFPFILSLYRESLTTHTVSPDKSQSPSRGQFGQATRGKRANPRKERDDKIHDSLIEERIQRERPCRTLFIRNIKV